MERFVVLYAFLPKTNCFCSVCKNPLWFMRTYSCCLYTKFKYYVIFVDEHTRYTWLYPLKHKSNFFNTFLTFQWMVEINSSLRLKFINVMVVVSSLCKTFWLIWIIVGLLNRFHVPKHLSNMGLLNTNIGILWKLASPYCFTISYLSIMA